MVTVVHFVSLANAFHILPLGALFAAVVLLDAASQKTQPLGLRAVLFLVALKGLQDLIQQRLPSSRQINCIK